ncbi:uncharacterized protein LOC101104414 isoform X3 [Ovis aries]|uniref:uncharacterized protein LOC101104414 isoform X3 n=1 Tax=Ovis aries TaxID=9940 RepID=UPI0029526823|nr:uncharacterized protein LOC101104414 isoform X3 [Ovis aries]
MDEHDFHPRTSHPDHNEMTHRRGRGCATEEEPSLSLLCGWACETERIYCELGGEAAASQIEGPGTCLVAKLRGAEGSGSLPWTSRVPLPQASCLLTPGPSDLTRDGTRKQRGPEEQKLFLPEWPQQSDGHRGGIPERGVSVPGVTLESLREEDAGRYWCGIDTSWFEGMLRDPTFEVEVSVIPGTSLSLAGATLELHVDTVKVDIFLLHGLAGILPWNPGCLLSSQGPCYSHQHREVHRLPRLSHNPASAHLEHRVWSGDSRSQPTSSAPAGQRPLPAPGLPEGAAAPGHARCCPLGPQASEELCGQAESVHL